MEASPDKHGGRRRAKTLMVWRAIGLVWHAAPFCALFIVAITVLQGLFPLLVLHLTRLIVDSVVQASSAGGTGRMAPTVFLLMGLGGALLIRAACAEMGRLATQAQALAVEDRVLEIIHEKSVELDLEFYEAPHYRDTFHRALQDAPYRPTEVVQTLANAGQSGIALISILGLLVSFHWSLPLVLVVATLPGLLVSLDKSGEMFRWLRERTATQRRADYYHWLLTGEMFAKEIRLLGTGGEFMARCRDLRRLLRQERLQLATRRGIAELVAELLSICAMLAAWAWMLARAIAGEMSLGSLLMYKEAFQQGQTTLSRALATLSEMYQHHLFLSTLFDLLDLQPTVTAPRNPAPVPTHLREGILFENVCFSYPGTKTPVLHDVSFFVPAGKTVVLAGENGAGKTTLLKLLTRLYNPTQGRIRLDSVDLDLFDPLELRAQVSTLSQDFGRFQLSVGENIWLGDVKRGFGLEEIKVAANDAAIHRFIETLPDGYDTLLGRQFERGCEFSVGQWQRVALARAFFRYGPIVALDEPSSALDPRAEYELARRIHELLSGRTALVVSHRLLFARMADWVVVLENGCVAEQGTHDELMRLEGKYAFMFSAQASHYS